MTEKGKALRIVFMGTPDFAVESLKALTENGYQLVGVITAPDKPAGRGKKLAQSAVKKYALEKGITLLQPEKLKNPDFLKALKKLNADLQVVVAFRMLPEVVWNMPPLGTFNLHASLLPQYRGAAPINWAVINGETKTGLTTFLLDDKIDTGKILIREEIEIGPDETAGDVHDKLMHAGTYMVCKTVDALAEGNINPIPQSELDNKKAIKHAPKIFKDDCRINWLQDTEQVRNHIRGLSPYPAAWTELSQPGTEQNTPVKIFYAKTVNNQKSGVPGTIKTDGKTFLHVACQNGWLAVTDIQLAGKKRLAIANFLRGFSEIERYVFR
jgi:methionyl-tRNA formyltransferase